MKREVKLSFNTSILKEPVHIKSDLGWINITIWHRYSHWWYGSKDEQVKLSLTHEDAENLCLAIKRVIEESNVKVDDKAEVGADDKRRN